MNHEKGRIEKEGKVSMDLSAVILGKRSRRSEMKGYSSMKAGKSLIVVALVVFLSSSLTYAYNKSWDQGHQCTQSIPGAAGWGRYAYSTTSDQDYLGGNFSTEDCCKKYCTLCPVYANTGRLQKSFTDLRVPGIGPSLVITRDRRGARGHGVCDLGPRC